MLPAPYVLLTFAFTSLMLGGTIHENRATRASDTREARAIVVRLLDPLGIDCPVIIHNTTGNTYEGAPCQRLTWCWSSPWCCALGDEDNCAQITDYSLQAFEGECDCFDPETGEEIVAPCRFTLKATVTYVEPCTGTCSFVTCCTGTLSADTVPQTAIPPGVPTTITRMLQIDCDGTSQVIKFDLLCAGLIQTTMMTFGYNVGCGDCEK